MGAFYPESPYISKVKVTNPPTLADYQVYVNVPWRAGMRGDFADLRFGTEDVTLPLWLEDYIPFTSATVWTKLPIIGTKEFLCYYGGNSQSVSDGSAVNVFFDHFDKGTSLDTSKWEGITGTWAVANHVVTNTISTTYTNRRANIKGVTASYNYVYRIKVKYSNTGNICCGLWCSNTPDGIGVSAFCDGHFHPCMNISAIWSEFGSCSQDTYYVIEGHQTDANNWYGRCEAQSANWTSAGVGTGQSGLGGIMHSAGSNSPSTLTADWFAVRIKNGYGNVDPTCTLETDYIVNPAFYQSTLRAKHFFGPSLSAAQHDTHIDLAWSV